MGTYTEEYVLWYKPQVQENEYRPLINTQIQELH